MPINTLATATLFQKNLDTLAVQQMKTGWMDANAGQVIYTGGKEIKIPKLSVQGLADYDRDDGYVMGSVTMDYETRTMTQDRGRKFQLDAMDVDETAFVATAANVMGEFQRVKVIPEIDAYRLAMLADTSMNAGGGAVKYSYNPSSAGKTLYELKKGIAYLRDNGYDGPLVIHAIEAFMLEFETEMAGKLTAVSWKQGGIETMVPSIDDVPIIRTPANRMMSAIDTLDGTTSGEEAGGYKAATGAIQANFLIMPMDTPIAVTKQDKMKIFSPDQNQDADAWKMNYRRFHDIWVKDNRLNSVYGNFLGAKPAGK